MNSPDILIIGSNVDNSVKIANALTAKLGVVVALCHPMAVADPIPLYLDSILLDKTEQVFDDRMAWLNSIRKKQNGHRF